MLPLCDWSRTLGSVGGGVEVVSGVMGRRQGHVTPAGHEVIHAVVQALHVPSDHVNQAGCDAKSALSCTVNAL